MINGMAVVEFMGMNIEHLLKSPYTRSIITLIGFFLGAKLVTVIAEKYILKLTAKTETDIDDLLVQKTHEPVSLLLLVLGIKLAIIPLGLQENINTLVHRGTSTLSVILLIYLAVKVIEILIKGCAKRKAAKREKEMDENLVKVSCKTTRFLALLLGLIFVLKIWRIEIGPLLASLGIVGIAVAFGLQSTLGNIFGGISLLIDRSIKLGDIVKIDDSLTGTVMDVGLRSTRIRTWDNEVIMIPNGKLASSNIRNYVLPNPTERIVVPFSVAYGSDIDKVKKVVMKEIMKLDNLEKNHDPAVMFLEMGESSLNFKAFVWLKSYKERFTTKEKLNCMIYNTLNKNRISIPFPQMDVHLKNR
ncbi:mechanosensitive ion channel family protein [Candidatus Woesearchaeota archaeon]|nr:mechanosensitive ion channel family protein [Candidatus Woesearchaeota archaeon]